MLTQRHGCSLGVAALHGTRGEVGFRGLGFRVNGILRVSVRGCCEAYCDAYY